MREIRDAIVVIPGTRWEDTQGTDHRLAEALAEHYSVLWVDPPVPIAGPARVSRPSGMGRTHLDQVQRSITRLRYRVTPGFTRPGIDVLSWFLRDAALRRARTQLGLRVRATLLLSPRDRFPTKLSGRRLLHVTDDWVGGAALMGLDPRRVADTLKKNLAVADAVSVISPYLATTVRQLAAGAKVKVVPNGCRPALPQTAGSQQASNGSIVLLGQLNERLDLDLLELLMTAGLKIEVVGPRRERDPEVSGRLDRFLGAGNVRWHGEVPPSEVPGRLAGASVGITPYLDNEFNKASFPLKTLDYLAAGVPVVSTDSPAVRWLNSPFIKVAETSREFLQLVSELAAQVPAPDQRQRMRTFAGQHSWQARASDIIDEIEAQS